MAFRGLILLFVLACASAAPFSGEPAQVHLSPDESLARLLIATPRIADMREIAVALGAESPPPRVTGADAAPRSVGDVESFWISRQNPPSHVRATARLRLVSRRAYWYVEEDLAASDEALRASADVFDSRIYPEVRRLLGSELFPGIDNDPRVTIFHGSMPGLAGYVSSNDSYPASVRPFSNEREVIYLNPRIDPVGSDEYLSTLTHELTHLVHWGVNPAEDTWAKEGLGFLMPSLVFPDRRLSSASFAETPSLALTSWTGDGREAASAAAHYQAAAWFLRYLIDRGGAVGLGCLLRTGEHGLARHPAPATCGYPAAGFSEMFQDWLVANVVGTRQGVGVSPYVDRTPDPPRTQKLDAPSSTEGTVAQFGAIYYELPEGAAMDVEFSGRTTVPIVSAAADHAPIWYAGRRDGSIASMSSVFDLSRTVTPRLEYEAWVDTETDYDFLYVLASRDAGRTWTLLSAPSMSTGNATGTNLGIGYTGRGSPAAPGDWLSESIDLTDYAGGPAGIAFWYVTDDAIGGQGVALRNITVSGARPQAGPDAHDEGWAAEGWSRISPLLPQLWSVQVIEIRRDGVHARRVPVDAAGRAIWTVDPEAGRAIVAISGLTPITLERASFTLTVRRRL